MNQGNNTGNGEAMKALLDAMKVIARRLDSLENIQGQHHKEIVTDRRIIEFPIEAKRGATVGISAVISIAVSITMILSFAFFIGDRIYASREDMGIMKSRADQIQKQVDREFDKVNGKLDDMLWKMETLNNKVSDAEQQNSINKRR